MDYILEFLYRLNAEDEISDELILETYRHILDIVDKEKSNSFINILFTYLMLKRKNVDIITKLLKISFEKDDFKPFSVKINDIQNNIPIILYAGSGKKGIKTINISTISSIIATSMGAKILKPCSMATSSKSGSFDFLSIIGINTNLNEEETIGLLKRTGFGVFPIEKIIPKFDSVYGDVFYAPNILSYALASLVCPIKPDIILYGLANKDIEISGEVLQNFGIEKYRIVSSQYDERYYMDELNIFGTSFILDNGEQVRKIDFGDKLTLSKYDTADIKQANTKKENILLALKILEGKDWNSYSELVALNTANILQLSGIVNTIEEGFYLVKSKIKSGECINWLKLLVVESKGNIKKLNKLLEEL